METKFTRRKILPSVMLLFIVLLIIPGINSDQIAFAESITDSKPTILVADHLKNNPLAIKIITEMEKQKLRYKQYLQGELPTTQITVQQTELDQNRKIAQSLLEKNLESMQKKYEDFSPRNSFERFVSNLNSTYHGIFWDQFDYLEAKVKLATAAKNSVLEDGGSFYEAQQEYFKYASMPRIEMINFIEELNVRYGFSDQDTQTYFDANGKLPRYDDDKDAPCYGCENSKISKSQLPINISKMSSIDSQNYPESIQKAGIDNLDYDNRKNEIQILKNQLSDLRQKFLDEGKFEQKKSLVDSMNEVVRKIQELTYNGKYL